MKINFKKSVYAITLFSLMTAGLFAKDTVGNKVDRAIDRAERKAESIKDRAREGKEKVKDKAHEGLDKL